MPPLEYMPPELPKLPSSPPAITAVVCRSCGKVIDLADPFCRFCGQRQVDKIAWYHQPIWIAILTVTFLGPFSIPLVWKSPKFTQRGKWIATIVIVLLTIFACVQVYKTFESAMASYGELMDANNSF